MPDSVLFSSIVNGLHFSTRDYTIRKNLLFSEGLLLDTTAMIESEKILRDLDFIREVSLRKVIINSDSVDIIVSYKEMWTTNLGASLKINGTYYDLGMRFNELNLLGYGTGLSFSFNNTGHGKNKDVIIKENNLFGSFANTTLQYKNYYNQKISTLEITKDFASSNIHWIYKLYSEYYRGEQHLPDMSSDDYRRSVLSLNLAKVSGGDIKYVINGGINYKGENIPGRYDNSNSSVLAGIDVMKIEYSKIKGINYFTDFETLPLGYISGIIFEKKGTSKSFGFGTASTASAQLNEAYVAGTFTTAVGFLPDRTSVYGEIKMAYRIASTVLAAKVSSKIRNNPEYLDKFNYESFRSFQGDELWTNKFLNITLEHRIFDLYSLLGCSFGASFFIDYARLNYPENGKPNFKQFCDFGAGLRIEPTYIGGIKTLRMDFAFNPYDKKVVFSLGASQYFSAIGNLELWQLLDN